MFNKSFGKKEGVIIKVIFLDIDGVLNGYDFWSMLGWKISCLLHISRWYKNHSRDPFGIHKEKVKRLAAIVNKTDAKIVMSSSWRRAFWNVPYEEKSSNQRLLVDSLRKCNLEVIDITPFHPSGRRDKEILAWLTKNEDKLDNFIILDDERYDLECFSDHLIQTSSIKDGEIIKGHWTENTGLKHKDIKKAVAMLNKCN